MSMSARKVQSGVARILIIMAKKQAIKVLSLKIVSGFYLWIRLVTDIVMFMLEPEFK